MPRGTTSRVPITQYISGVSAESSGKVFAGYVDNSNNSEYYGGTHYHQHPGKFLGKKSTVALTMETLDPPETPPSPLSTVPFRRDPDFVDRGTLLDQIHEKGSIPGSRIALIGLGGVGKSQLAIEYCYRVRDQSPDTWVFWVHASNATRLEQSFRDIADQAKILGRHDPTVNIFQLVESWLQDGKRGKWLLILDNVDDDGFLRQPLATVQQGLKIGQTNAATKPLLEYLPRSPNGSIIITSRSQEVALKIVDHQDVLKIEPMNRSEALELLQRKLGLPEETPDILKLVEELEFMPLAIIQAAGYIVHRAPLCSVSQYLEMFRKSDREATKLLDYGAGHLYRDWEAKSSILVTWQISFDHIRRIRPSAADLLSLMSFFDRQGVFKNLLRIQGEIKNDSSSSEEIRFKYNDEDMDSTSESDADHDFGEDITTLRDFSFISINKDSTVFTMHRLVQLTVRVWLKANRQLERWKEQFVMILWERFPTGEYENWARCQSLFPHVKSAMSQRPKSQDSLEKWATLLYKGAWYAQESGNIAESRDMAYNSRKQRALLFGSEGEQTLDSTAMLANAHGLEGRWKRAEQLEVQVMETRKMKLGADHPDTLTSMANLASTYGHQGRWEEAEQLEVQVMETSKTKLGADHPNTLIIISNLASTYRNQGRWEEAEQLEVQVIETYKTKLGADHPDTLMSIGNLASTFWNQGRWEEAEQLDVQVMETRKTKLGADHPDTLTSIGNLASTYRNQGRWKEAEQLQVQVMEISKTKLGADHPHTLRGMANLASTYRNQGRWEETEQLLVQVIEMSKTKLGADHPDTLMSMGNLASTFWNQGRWEEAEQLDVQVMETRKTKLGADHPDTLTSMGNLASTYRNQGRWEEAEQLQVQVMEINKTKLGADHPDTLRSMGNLASTFWNQGRFEEAEQLNVQVIETSKTKLGADHPDTLRSMGNLALTYGDQGRWEEAEQLNVQTKLGADYPDTLRSIGNLASTYINQGRWEETEQLLVQVIEMSKTKLGADHPHTLRIWAIWRRRMGNQGRWEETEQLLVQVMETFKTKLGADHPHTLTIMANLAHTLRSLGQDKAALQLMAKCLRLRDRKLGPDHPDTMSSKSTLNEWRGKCDSLSS
ncbi:uncharacterized protein N7477_009108 [Penicillium maclennaniae]|uniref:uncharacterized protein n=1 Tax=Penicillium maclennaniae TaxID=1343394 RepID=UPI00254144A4|nr:uncharacterized protein N7477_009108 [Penicillium maclennaniae]KAJ5661492.1 hypothetical protein N7477_009108 [Penicillium maclennaniae]